MDRSILSAVDEQTRQRYNARLERLGAVPMALGWDTRASQWARFRAGTRLADTSGRSVLDVGCGFGDLLVFLEETGQAPAAYHGVDINPRLLEEAGRRHPDAHFENRNLLADPLDQVADVVFMFGLLNFRLSQIDNYEFAREMIEAAWRATRDVVVVDMLSSVREESYLHEEFVFYYEPGRMLSWALTLTPHAAIQHDLPSIPQREFQLVLRRTSAV